MRVYCVCIGMKYTNPVSMEILSSAPLLCLQWYSGSAIGEGTAEVMDLLPGFLKLDSAAASFSSNAKQPRILHKKATSTSI